MVFRSWATLHFPPNCTYDKHMTIFTSWFTLLYSSRNAFLVTRNPGVGKSFFALYELYYLLKEIVDKKSNAAIVCESVQFELSHLLRADSTEVLKYTEWPLEMPEVPLMMVVQRNRLPLQLKMGKQLSSLHRVLGIIRTGRSNVSPKLSTSHWNLWKSFGYSAQREARRTLKVAISTFSSMFAVQ